MAQRKRNGPANDPLSCRALYRRSNSLRKAASTESNAASLIEIRDELFRVGVPLAKDRDIEFANDPQRKLSREAARTKYMAASDICKASEGSTDHIGEAATAAKVDALYAWVMA